MSNNYTWAWNDGESTYQGTANTLSDILAEVLDHFYGRNTCEIEISESADYIYIQRKNRTIIINSISGVIDYLWYVTKILDRKDTFEIMCN